MSRTRMYFVGAVIFAVGLACLQPSMMEGLGAFLIVVGCSLFGFVVSVSLVEII